MSTIRDLRTTSLETGVPIKKLQQLCKDGLIESGKIGKSWVVDSSQNEKIWEVYEVNNDKSYSGSRINKHIVLSFFSGAMGLDLGLERAGFETRLACEIDKSARATIMKNKPNIALIGDITKYTPQQILECAKVSDKEEVDLIVGGPPCQAFSTAGKRLGFEDKRGNVFIDFLNVIKSIQPKIAIIENVRGILSANIAKESIPNWDELDGSIKNSTKAIDFVVNYLKSFGYGVSYNLYNSANYGSPQKRERVVIVACKNGQISPFLSPSHSQNGEFNLPPWRTFREAVQKLENKHDYLNFPEKRLKYYRILKEGECWKNLPEELQKEALGKAYYLGGGKTGFLRRIKWDEPAPTLVTHPAMPATDLAHPVELRPLSVQEYKAIQEFPEGWFISGGLVDIYKQIGNAVPISLGYAIGQHVLKLLNNEPITVLKNFSYSRYKNTSSENYQQPSLF